MRSSEPKTIFLKDYKVPNYLIDRVDLKFEIGTSATTVTATSHFRRHPKGEAGAPLVLNGEHLNLHAIDLDGQALPQERYQVDDKSLTISDVPAEFDLKVVTEIEPDKNTALEGLYRSGHILCTQNEAEGFRRITYFLDRPDVMAVYTTTIVADKSTYPVLLSNGNLVEKVDLGDGKHQAKWHDPHPKPCYLYALVAGDLGMIADTFTTRSGREVRLELYVDKGDEPKATHAMESLKRAMKWDEEVFGLEYDLDIYMITSVHSFNAGAMENKGLNIFNSKFVLAAPETATDAEYEGIESVIAHEYFHNWTGNRVTCRDWFQLSLKEGLTVFRDQEFTSDMTSRPVKRINDVNRLRSSQFAEDAGPMAHPVRPASYMSVNNFYTLTVYEKGSEVVRMIHTLLGPELFRKGMDKYFERFDGQAVTTDDFVQAMQDVSGIDLTQFKRWYEQSGTPEIRFDSEYNADEQSYELTLSQTCPPTPGQETKQPFHIPVAIGLVNSKGDDIPLQLSGQEGPPESTKVLHLKQPQQTFRFQGVEEEPTLSLLRNFSAPVRVVSERQEKDLLFLMAQDNDPFSRWEAAQTLALNNIQRAIGDFLADKDMNLSQDYVRAFAPILKDESIDPAFKAQLLKLPDVSYIMQFQSVIDPTAINQAREFVIGSIAAAHRDQLEQIYNKLDISNNTDLSSHMVGQRDLRNTCLGLLSRVATFDTAKVALTQYKESRNMTVKLGAMAVLADLSTSEHDEAFNDFYKQFKQDTLTIDKWFSLQALSKRKDTLERVNQLTKDPAFDIKTPNKCYSLFAVFGMRNSLRFHDVSGKAYEFYADRVLEVDKLNPQVAARMVSAFNHWKKMEPVRKELMKKQLERIVATPDLSENTFEISSKALK